MYEHYGLFWGDTHHNSYTRSRQHPALDEVLEHVRSCQDFYSAAYYTPVSRVAKPLPGTETARTANEGGHHFERTHTGHGFAGVHLEGTKDAETLRREWAEVEAAVAAKHEPGRFVTFPGYEWQGNGRWGDHNVIFKQEGHAVHTPDTLAELYQALRGTEALAIPHHVGYLRGHRAPRWEACDETLSPFAEIYSVHGCSETDEEWIGLRLNSHMGPGAGNSTYQKALDRGLHIGAICSTDDWNNVPGSYGSGLMACWAAELTRDGLWEAFRARRVYGVTGDRIRLEFNCNGEAMGSIIDYTARRALRIAVRGTDAIDRIELLRNGSVIQTWCHQGAWTTPTPGRPTRFKLRVEPGWGPRIEEIPAGDRRWEGTLSLEGGRFVGWEPCWVARGQQPPELDGTSARFRMLSHQELITKHPTQGSTVFEFEADPAAELRVRVDGQEARGPVADFADCSRILWNRDESVERVRATTGVAPEGLPRDDVYYNLAHKVKLHRAIPEAGYTKAVEYIDEEPLDSETHYRVRVEQRNGQRAWSSPVWVKAAR